MHIFDIERYATKDGPGIRTVLFFKGCNLRCEWCQNPESRKTAAQLMYYRNKCAGCGRCADICPEEAVLRSEQYGFIPDEGRCTLCGACIDACFYDARKMIGSEPDTDSVMKVIISDKSYYEESGGGVTFSGGEPLFFADEVAELAERCRAENISTALETAAAVEWSEIKPLLNLIDLFFVDLKHIDSEVHRRFTGLGNDRIISNIEQLGAVHKNVIVRIPVIPGFNHSPDVICRMMKFLAERTEIRTVELLPFHRLGSGKYEGLGLDYPFADCPNLDRSECLKYEECGRMLGLSVRTGAV